MKRGKNLKYEVKAERPRGHELKGDGISYKCKTGRCQDCTALKCKHDCGHGAVSQTREPTAEITSGDIIITEEQPPQGIRASVNGEMVQPFRKPDPQFLKDFYRPKTF